MSEDSPWETTPSERLLGAILRRDLDALRNEPEGEPGWLDQVSEGARPLNEAVEDGWEEGVLLLLERGADVNAMCREVPWSALFEAVQRDRFRLALLLLEAGADPDACLPDHGWARDEAESLGRDDFLRLFEHFKPAPRRLTLEERLRRR